MAALAAAQMHLFMTQPSFDEKQKAPESRNILWLVVGVAGFFLFLFCAFCSVALGYVLLAGAPHAFGPSPGMAMLFFFLALLFVALAVFVIWSARRKRI